MAQYVDGFVIAVPKKNMKLYQRVARAAGKVWMEYGALAYFECVGEDLATSMGVSFTRLARAKPDETVVFSWIVYRSRAHRDRVNRQVMKDPRILRLAEPMPFHPRRMAYGGFKTIVAMG